MARIRTIKPEFWSSEQLIACSRDARLLFIGLWNFSDDFGVHSASYVRLKAEVFPADDLSVSEMKSLIDELINQRLIFEYEAQGQTFWFITGWKSHQKIDRPNGKYPRPTEESVKKFVDHSSLIRDPFVEHSSNERRIEDERSGFIRRTFVEHSSSIRDSFGIDSTTEGNGREGKGREKDFRTLMSSSPLAELDVDQLSKTKNQADTTNREIRKSAIEILDFLNSKTGRSFRPVDTNLKLIIARLKSGVEVEDCKAVIAKKFREWSGDEKMIQYLRPATLFNATKFEQYVGELIQVEEESNVY